MIKQNIKKIIIAGVFGVVLATAGPVSAANQPPHDASHGINCSACHLTFSQEATSPVWNFTPDPVNPDNNQVNNRVCWQAGCHIDTNSKKTHSSYSSDTTTYGTWSWTCTTCHDPHKQLQTKNVASVPTLKGTTTTVDSINKIFGLSLTLPDRTGDANPSNDYVGWTIVPNTVYKNYNYKITANTATTVTVEGTIVTAGVTANVSQFAIIPGKYVKDVISTPGGPKAVKFLQLEGQYSYVHNDTLAGGNDSTPDGVCQICHAVRTEGSAMKHARADGTGFVGDTHPTTTAANCKQCHDHKTLGLGSGGCTSCHGLTGNGAPLVAGELVGVQTATYSQTGHTVGAHSKHVTAPVQIACTICHNNNGMPTIDSKITVEFSGQAAGGTYQGKALSGGYTYAGSPLPSVGATETCSTVYCHSSGQSSTGGALTAGNYTNPDWENPASGACKTCHATTAPNIATGSHDQHLTSAVTMQCSDCHTGAGDGTTSPAANHVNNSMDVANGYTAGGPMANGYGTCASATGCHGSGTPTWGNPTAKAGCYRCHGDSANGNAAPGPDTAGNTATNDAQVGAHQAHLKGSSNITSVVACAECHKVPAAVETVDHIKDLTPGVAEVVFTDAVKANLNGATPGYTGGTCSTTYCHGGAMPKGTTNGAGNSPVWGNDTYLTGLATNDCNTCHLSPPSPATISAHVGKGLADCVSCHKVDGGLYSGSYNSGTDTYTITGTSYHIDGTLQVSGCNSCHDANNTLPGKHSVHYTSATDAAARLTTNTSTAGNYVFECGNCHNDETTHMGTPNFAVVSFNASWAPVTGGTYTANTGNGNDTADSKGNPISTDGTCSNLYCHSNGAGGAPNTAAAWNGAAMTCEGCHSYDASATNKMSSGSHTAHVNRGTVMANKGCQECHNATTTNGTSIADKTQHVDGQKDVALSATYGGSFLTNNCSTTYCHSDGKGNAPAVTANWGVTTTDCVSCHQGASAGTTLSGKHEAHLVNAGTTIGRNLTCDQCHADTASNNTTISTPANHVNKVKDIKVAIDNTACNNIKCHSSGNFDGTVAYNNPNFVTGSLGCVSCHGDGATKAYPSYADGGIGTGDSNSHNAHVATNSITCGECHATTSTAGTSIDGTTPANHVNQTVDVSFARGGNYNTPGNEQCSATYCHGSGVPTWGGSVACGDCHAANNTLPASHSTHYGIAANGSRALDTKVNNTTAYVFECGSCHNNVPHADGNKNVAMSATWGGSMDGLKTCSTVYCHSDGNGGAGTNPTWATSTMTCGSCHAAEPATARHTKHVDNATYNINCSQCHAVTTTDGITINDKFQHVDKTKDVDWGSLNTGGTPYVNAATNCGNIYCHSDGKSATAPFGAPKDAVAWGTAFTTTCASCHDNANATTTLSGAHKAHVNGATATVGRDLGCEQCHSDTVSNSTTISSYANHVNQVKDIKVAIDNTACNNIKCHSDGNVDGTPVYNNPVWTTTLGCTSCHGDGATKAYPSYADGGVGTGVSNSHNKHVGSSSIKCEECHQTVSIDGTAINGTTPAEHVNQSVNVTFKQGGTYNGVPNTATTETCSTTYCHGGSTPTWGGGAIACDGCHDATNTIPGNLSTRHDRHYASGSVPSDRSATNNHSATGYVFGCGNCHPNGTTHATGRFDSTGPVLQDAEIDGTNLAAANYTQGLSSLTDGRNYNFSVGGTCSTYCHSSGNVLGGTVTYKAPKWNDAASGACNVCHNDATTPLATNKHAKHIDNTTYDYKCEECHGATVTGDAGITTAAQRTNHANGTNNVVWKTGGLNDGATAYAQPNCASMYCHSQGTDLVAPFDAASAPKTAVAWNGVVTSGCGICHGDTTTGPDYTSGSPKTNSHNKHVVANSYVCNECHSGTVDALNAINYAGGKHINKTYDVSGAKIGGYTYNVSGGTCSTVSCHGGNNPTWGATLTCADCHSGTGDTDDYTYGNGTTAKIDSTEWTTLGHGQATIALACNDCHDGAVNHNTGANPFRLANIAAKLNDNCLVCHATGSAGYNTKNSTVKVDKYHAGASHDATRNGGQFCWDCHDPHGDGSNIKMVQSKPARKSDANGVPTELPTNAVVFTDNTIPTGAGGWAMTVGTFEQGLCNTCHTNSAAAPKMVHYNSTASDSHNSAQVCTNCHKHSSDTVYDGQAFKGAGDCNSCHDYDTRVANNWGDGYTPQAIQGFGAHKKHIDHLKTRLGLGALAVTGQTYGAGVPKSICGVCHSNDEAADHGKGGRNINFGGAPDNATYQFGPATPLYMGVSGNSSSVNPKSCSSVSCHFTATPVWNAY